MAEGRDELVARVRQAEAERDEQARLHQLWHDRYDREVSELRRALAVRSEGEGLDLDREEIEALLVARHPLPEAYWSAKAKLRAALSPEGGSGG